MTQLAAVGQQQDTLLREIAVRREGAEIVFPPLHSKAEIQKNLPEGHALLVFFVTSRQQLYAFLVGSGLHDYSYWQVGLQGGSAGGLSKKIQDLLRQMGQYEANHEMTMKSLGDDQWKLAARNLLAQLLKGSKADFSQPFEELIVVPDGVLWYLPFEALQVEVNQKLRPLLGRCRIRYLPLASLVVPDGRGQKPATRTAVAASASAAREMRARGTTATCCTPRRTRSFACCPAPCCFPPRCRAPSAVYMVLYDRVVVLDAVQPENAPYAWSPIPAERGKAGATLDDWLALPWSGAEQLVFAGHHTAAEAP